MAKGYSFVNKIDILEVAVLRFSGMYFLLFENVWYCTVCLWKYPNLHTETLCSSSGLNLKINNKKV